MPVTNELNVRRLLKRFLDECPKCRALYVDCVSDITNGEDPNDEQAEWILIHLNNLHVESH